MKELSLFTGIGGGLLGTHGLLGWQCVGAVEWEEYPCRVLRQRQIDGVLDEFPIWNMDIREFNRRIAPEYAGMVDVITAGFPCQPFSLAGKQRGAADERNMWPATIECIRVVRPRHVLLENVPGLISNGYLATVLGDLARSGYDARWRRLSAAELGAPHRRDRLWIVAYRDSIRNIDGATKWGGVTLHRPNRNTPATITQWEKCKHGVGANGAAGDVADAANANRRQNGRPVTQPAKRRESGRGGRRSGTGNSWWATEPQLGRVAHGVPNRVDRLKAIGNGQVPAVAATAWLLLTEGLDV